jgi:hypothetical protein
MSNASTSTTNPTTPVPADGEQISPNITLQVTFKQGRTKVQGRGRVAEKLSQAHIDALLSTLQDENSEVDATGTKPQRDKFVRMVKNWAETAGTTNGFGVQPHFTMEKSNTDNAGVVHSYLTEVR